MKKAVFFLLSLFLSVPAFAQKNYIFRGDTRYSSTPSWEFRTEEGFGRTLEVQIARRSGGKGLLFLSTSAPLPGVSFEGTVILYLAGATTIKCYDRNINDRVNDQARALYYLTEEEINRLKRSDIDQIRFSLTGYGGFGESGKHFVVINKSLVGALSSYGGDSSKRRYPTAEGVRELFSQPH